VIAAEGYTGRASSGLSDKQQYHSTDSTEALINFKRFLFSFLTYLHQKVYRARQLYKNISVISVSGEKGFVVYKYIID